MEKPSLGRLLGQMGTGRVSSDFTTVPCDLSSGGAGRQKDAGLPTTFHRATAILFLLHRDQSALSLGSHNLKLKGPDFSQVPEQKPRNARGRWVAVS